MDKGQGTQPKIATSAPLAIPKGIGGDRVAETMKLFLPTFLFALRSRVGHQRCRNRYWRRRRKRGSSGSLNNLAWISPLSSSPFSNRYLLALPVPFPPSLYRAMKGGRPGGRKSCGGFMAAERMEFERGQVAFGFPPPFFVLREVQGWRLHVEPHSPHFLEH